MIVTEAEAKLLRCCGPSGCGRNRDGFIVIADDDEIAEAITVTRMQNNPAALHGGGRYCIGTACMAWRWVEPPIWKEPKPTPTNGYCGLAR